MSKNTNISWTDHTFNPWWGCEKVSPGCAHCYAEALAKRWRHYVWGKGKKHRMFGEDFWREPYHWNKAAEKAGKRSRVFCGSMMDWAQDAPELIPPRARLLQTIRETPHLIWQLLTKRPQNVRKYAVDWDLDYPNVWLGVSVENADWSHRIETLRGIPAALRFVSYEPALGPLGEVNLEGIGWLICGGESGRNRRPFDPDWARQALAECRAHGVAFFFKQSGGLLPGSGDTLNGKEYKEFPTFRG